MVVAVVSSKTSRGDKLSEIVLPIKGIHRSSCIPRDSQALNLGEGVNILEVRLGAARISSRTQPAPVDWAIGALAKAGYSACLEK